MSEVPIYGEEEYEEDFDDSEEPRESGLFSPGPTLSIPKEREEPPPRRMVPPAPQVYEPEPVPQFQPAVMAQPQRMRSVGNPDLPYSAATSDSAMLGLATIGAAAGAVVGYARWGFYGSVAGCLFSGSIINIYRGYKYGKNKDTDSKTESKVAYTYAAVSAGMGAYLIAKSKEKSSV